MGLLSPTAQVYGIAPSERLSLPVLYCSLAKLDAPQPGLKLGILLGPSKLTPWRLHFPILLITVGTVANRKDSMIKSLAAGIIGEDTCLVVLERWLVRLYRYGDWLACYRRFEVSHCRADRGRFSNIAGGKPASSLQDRCA